MILLRYFCVISLFFVTACQQQTEEVQEEFEIAEAGNGEKQDPDRLEVVFTQPGVRSDNTETLWISNSMRGSTSDLGGLSSGVKSFDDKAQEKLDKCRVYFKSLVNQEVDSQAKNEVITVTLLMEGKLEKKTFSRNKVPDNIGRIISLLGHETSDFSGLRFVRGL